MNRMISVEEAIELCVSNTRIGHSASYGLEESGGKYLAENVTSPIDLPSFRNSAMDGYVLLWEDYQRGNRQFKLVGEIEAGNTQQHEIISGECYRIFTGAAVPVNAGLVIMQENVTREGDTVSIVEEGAVLDQNIRQKAEQIARGEIALEKGSHLHSASIGYLASLGIDEVTCICPPKIKVISTGNELIKPGGKLNFGQIYESNSAALLTEIDRLGIEGVEYEHLPDDYHKIEESIANALANFDYLILSGGISVGDYDFVGKAVKNLNIEEVFYKVKQKPGKPLYFGKKGNCCVFGLPGNPAAALSCFKVYVRSSILKFMGAKETKPQFLHLQAGNSFRKKGNRAQFLKAQFVDGGVNILEGQSSNMMHTFAVSDCLVYLSEEESEINSGDWVSCLLL
jgi:molybdopterin molybdotransferase